ncbi:vWA domain-containing protein [Thetidibacter halocola]|uniref:VWA domain-containing protein n=1 Tax=Thetidibacter halocola TaxID=2827239 RepID=A0A8J7WF68_9RHOB|nr:VWA domain-containing protein [Thetidibacter halocola]MBS0125264.1 VWA domain-containing protein [Thetidibacter halocola]
MSRVTRFAARDPGPMARLSAFMDHLRSHGFQLGVSETATATSALLCLPTPEPGAVRSALRAVCAGNAEQAARFDALFDAFWMDAGRVRQKAVPTDRAADHTSSSRRDEGAEPAAGAGGIHAPDGHDGGEAESDGEGLLQAARNANLMKKDLRDLVSPDDIRQAEAIARRLGAALRDRRSRRRKAARRGSVLDFRRTIRRALQTGGAPLRLAMRRRPDRPVKIAALVDVSGSMLVYARPFLAFLAGLLRADDAADAYLFHTRLTRITEALRDEDPMRALNRTTLLADGIGGGSKIGGALQHFNRSYARRLVDGRTVVLILSDGYDTDPPEAIADALAELRRRGCRIVWLNPLKGWRGYEPVARGMAAALPHLDLFEAANTLDDLAALEQRLEAL